MKIDENIRYLSEVATDFIDSYYRRMKYQKSQFISESDNKIAKNQVGISIKPQFKRIRIDSDSSDENAAVSKSESFNLTTIIEKSYPDGDYLFLDNVDLHIYRGYHDIFQLLIKDYSKTVF